MDLERSLNLNIEQNIHALIEFLFHIRSRRAVGVCDIDGVLEKFVVCDHISELVQVNKEILLAVDLAGSGLSCGRRDREADIVPALERLEHDGALTRSGRTGNYDQFSSLFSHFLFLPRLCLKFVPPKPPASTMIKSHVRCP